MGTSMVTKSHSLNLYAKWFKNLAGIMELFKLYRQTKIVLFKTIFQAVVVLVT